MITASIITLFLYYFRESFLSAFLGWFESAVAIMLIGLGAFAFKDVGLFHTHRHNHDGPEHIHLHLHLRGAREEHYHRHMFGIGIVQGLASNDELLILFTASLGVSSLFGILVGIATFSIGVVLGMILYGIILNYPLLRSGREMVRRYFNLGTGTLSVAYGVMLLLAAA